MYSSVLCSFGRDLTYCHYTLSNASNLMLEILKHDKIWGDNLH